MSRHAFSQIHLQRRPTHQSAVLLVVGLAGMAALITILALAQLISSAM